ncbi:MAG: hypothetical protein GY883_03390 [Shimia sp.]|nr:hypothetical protein [Shimia sp.]
MVIALFKKTHHSRFQNFPPPLSNRLTARTLFQNSASHLSERSFTVYDIKKRAGSHDSPEKVLIERSICLQTRDGEAAKVLEEAYPGREVVGVPARDIVIGGGNVHCVTQQQPARRVI